MAEETGETGGQSAVAETSGQSEGQSNATEQTTAAASSSNGAGGTDSGGESFFDYESIKGTDLEPAYKEMQRAFGRKNEQLKSGLDKISQYDNFMQNPVESIRQVAQQHGYQLVQGNPQDQNGQTQNFSNWDDVMAEAEKRVMEKLQPMFGEMKNLKQQTIQQNLDTNFPDWRTYEDSMMENLQAHPTLVNNPELLYRMSIPSNVLDARATKRAMQKLQGQNDAGTIQSQSTTTQQASKSPTKMTFDQAVAHARTEVRRQGLAPPRGE